MRSRHGIIVALAAGISLLLHAAVLSSFRAVRVGGGWGPAERFEEMTINLVPPESDPEGPQPQDSPQELHLGEAGANGYASHKTSGDRTAVAREAPVDQAALSLDPVGTEVRPEEPAKEAGPGATDAAAPTLELVSPPALARPLVPLVAAVVPSRQPIPVAVPPLSPPPSVPNAPVVAVAPPMPATLAPALAAAPTAPPVAADPVAASPAAGPPPSRPAPSKPGGGADPAPMSDSESDAFSVLGSARFVNGELRVRAGRKVRSRRPKIGLAGQLDAVYSRVEVTLRVAIDKTGKVTAVEVAKSSGSNEIDQPCRVSMYDWWFEPKKDAAGNPVPDRFNFTIGFQ